MQRLQTAVNGLPLASAAFHNIIKRFQVILKRPVCKILEAGNIHQHTAGVQHADFFSQQEPIVFCIMKFHIQKVHIPLLECAPHRLQKAARFTPVKNHPHIIIFNQQLLLYLFPNLLSCRLIIVTYVNFYHNPLSHRPALAGCFTCRAPVPTL